MTAPRPDIAAARKAFGERLCAALAAAGIAASSKLVHAEMRRRGRGAITIFAVRKWLAGDAIPTQASLRQLADWLRVPPAWLRFGDGSELAASAAPFDTDAALDLAMLAALRRRNPDDVQLVRELVLLLARCGPPGA